MTASRTCRACGAELSPDVMWCLRCYEPVRQLTPREPQLPTPAGFEPIDPALVRRDQAWPRLERPVYSRIRAGATTFGLWGRVGLTALVLFWLPWGRFGFVSVLYLLVYLPIAGLLLAAIWRKDVVGRGDDPAVVVERHLVQRIRLGALVAGVTLAGEAAASHAGPLGFLPAGLILTVAAFGSAPGHVAEAIREAQARPLGSLVLLNGLNLLDLILSDAAVGAGVARELNPLVIAIGPIAKLIVVAACGAVLLWKQPRAIVWPALVFLVLAAYHLTGLLGNLGLA